MMDRIPSPNAIDDPSALLGSIVLGQDYSFVTAPGYRADKSAIREPWRLYWDSGAALDEISDIVQRMCRCPVTAPTTHIRLFNADYSRFGCVLLHNATPSGDVELLAFATPGIWNRNTVRAVARWVFIENDFRRATVRIRSSDMRARGYAMRLGFRLEGTQRRWFADDDDAILLGVSREHCRWLDWR